MSHTVRLCAVLLSVSVSSAAWAVDPAAQAFLDGVYAPYRAESDGVDLGSKAQVARLFTPSMAALIAKDNAEAAKTGMYGRLDVDPFIWGQDWAPTKVTIAVRDGRRPDKAIGTAAYTVLGSRVSRRTVLDLSKRPAGWHVSDIRGAGQGSESLRQILTGPLP